MQRAAPSTPSASSASLSNLLFTRMRVIGRHPNQQASIRSANQSPQLCFSPASTPTLSYPSFPLPPSPPLASRVSSRLWIAPFKERDSPQPKQMSTKQRNRKKQAKTLLLAKSQGSFDFLCTPRNTSLSPKPQEGKLTFGLYSLHQQRRLLLKRLAGEQLKLSLSAARLFTKPKRQVVQHRTYPVRMSTLLKRPRKL
jgi:hypothetical protein